MREEQIGFIRATQIGNLLLLGVTHRIMGRIATVRQDWNLADRHFRQAYDYCLGVDAKHELGRVLVDFATMWRSWAASGAPGTRVSFGKWTRRAWMGAGYLVARTLDPDGINSHLVDRFGEE